MEITINEYNQAVELINKNENIEGRKLKGSECQKLLRVNTYLKQEVIVALVQVIWGIEAKIANLRIVSEHYVD